MNDDKTSGWTGRSFEALSGEIKKTGTAIDTDKDGKSRGLVNVYENTITHLEKSQNNILTEDQRFIIKNELSQSKRIAKLRDVKVHEEIIQRIEGALSRLSTINDVRETYEPLDRVTDFSRSIIDASKQIARLREYERNCFELLGCDIGRLESDMKTAADATRRVLSSMKLGQGEKYGVLAENKSRFLADHMAEFWRYHLELPTGRGSAFRGFFDFLCDQVGLPILGRDAMDKILKGAGKPTG